MSAPQLPVCKKAGCPAATTKNCAEGHSPLESCPWYSTNAPEEPTADLRGDPLDDSSVSDDDFVELPAGTPLTPEALNEFLRTKPIRLVSIAGDRESGKTTLICAIYEDFLKGRYEDLLFGGSRTLVGFEERSHESRTASGRVLPDTAHTSHGEGLRFFHLGIAPAAEDSGPQLELMMSDRAGETYAAARDKPPLSRDLIELVKADRVAILLDGKRVVAPETRGSATQGVRKLLRALIDGGALTKHSNVQVILTKEDLVLKADKAAEIQQRIADFFDLLKRDFEDALGSLTFWRVAARDPDGESDSGLAPLLRNWLTPTPTHVPRTPLSGPRSGEFDRLLDRADLGYLP